MIPYEDLVIALQTWRAKQGLPVGQLSGALTPPPSAMAPAPTPPAPPPKQAFLSNIATPPPLATEESIDESSLIEEAHYENEGDDFALAFGALAPEADESTAINNPPPLGRPSENTLDEGTEVASPAGKVRTNNRNDDW